MLSQMVIPETIKVNMKSGIYRLICVNLSLKNTLCAGIFSKPLWNKTTCRRGRGAGGGQPCLIRKMGLYRGHVFGLLSRNEPQPKRIENLSSNYATCSPKRFGQSGRLSAVLSPIFHFPHADRDFNRSNLKSHSIGITSFAKRTNFK